MGTITELTDDDIGKTVYYIPNHAKDDISQWERGKIKIYSNDLAGAWVVYDGGNHSKVDHYKEYTAVLTDYSSLTWEKKETQSNPPSKSRKK